MSTSKNSGGLEQLVTPGDLARQFHRVRELSMNKAHITLDVSSPLVNNPVIFLQLCTWEHPAQGAEPIQHVWAQRIVSVPNGTISLWAVFDLLITGETIMRAELGRALAEKPASP